MALPANTCPNGQTMYQISANGATRYRAVAVQQTARSCPDGQYVSGIAADGGLVCAVPAGSGGGDGGDGGER